MANSCAGHLFSSTPFRAQLKVHTYHQTPIIGRDDYHFEILLDRMDIRLVSA